MGNFLRKNLLHAYNIGIIFILSLIVIFALFKENLPILGQDASYPLSPTFRFSNWIYTWDDIHFMLGADVPFRIAMEFPFLFTLALLEKLGFDIVFSQKIIFFQTFFVAGVSTYFLSITIFKERHFGALVSAIVYMFNPISLFLWQQLLFEANYGWAAYPLLVALFIKTVKSKGPELLKNSIIFGLGSLLYASSVPNPPLLGLVFLTLLYFYIYYFLKCKSKYNILISALVISIVYVLFNLWWIIPVSRSVSENYAAFTGNTDLLIALSVNSGYASFVNLFRILANTGYWDIMWGGQVTSPFILFYSENIVGILLGFLYPILAFSALIFIKKNKIEYEKVLVISALLIVTLFLYKGIHEPFGDIYRQLFLNVPGFTLYRSPTDKFGIVVSLFYALLIGLSLNHLFNLGKEDFDPPSKRPKSTKKKYNETIITNSISNPSKNRYAKHISVLLVVLLLIYQWPFFTGDFITNGKGALPTSHVDIPKYYYQASEWLSYQDEPFRILSLPGSERNSLFSMYIWGFRGVDITKDLFQKCIIESRKNNDLISQPLRDITYKSLDASVSQPSNIAKLSSSLYTYKLLNLMNVKYLLVHNDYAWKHMHYGSVNPEIITTNLKSQKGISFERSFGELDFYRVDNFIPRIYATSSITYMDGNITGLMRLLSFDDFPDYQTLIISSQSRQNQLFLEKTSRIFIIPENIGKLNRITIPKSDNYTLLVYSNINKTSVDYEIDQNQFKSTINKNEGLIGNILPLNTIFLEKGTHTISIETNSIYDSFFLNSIYDSFFLYSKNKILEKTSPKVSFRRESPVKYIVQVENATSPYFLTFSETYNNKWVAKINNKKIKDENHFIVNGYSNSWYIEELGSYEVELDYSTHAINYLAFLISILTFIGCVVYLRWDWRKTFMTNGHP